MEKDYMTVEDVIQYTGIEEQTVRRMLRNGEIPGRKIGRKWLCLPELVEKWFQSFMKGDSNGTD